MDYRKLSVDEISVSLFEHFHRHQVVTKCWRKIEGEWCIKEIPFTDDWGAEEYHILVDCLKNTISTGGMACGAFLENRLKGFVSVEPELFGSQKQYADLSSIHVSEDMRGQGIGRELFYRAVAWAKAHGAKKLYISAHSAVESQAFYKAMGCVEAKEYNPMHVEKEPCDCQLEKELTIDIRVIDDAHQADINIPNEPFLLFGRMIPSYTNETWSCTAEIFDESEVSEMCFPDENYDYDSMKEDSIFVGAYENDTCMGLAILQKSWNKYLYLYDLKVCGKRRDCGVGSLLMEKAKEIAKEQNYNGIYTIGQDNNLAACRFYLKSGFLIGGFDNHVYTGTKQEGKADIIFYLDC